ncbi:Hypothetical protein FKW44_003768, partial [Caligus rogercresseyi]
VKCVSRIPRNAPILEQEEETEDEEDKTRKDKHQGSEEEKKQGTEEKALKKGNTEKNSQKNLAKTRARLLKTHAKIWIGTTVVV